MTSIRRDNVKRYPALEALLGNLILDLEHHLIFTRLQTRQVELVNQMKPLSVFGIRTVNRKLFAGELLGTLQEFS